MQSVSQFRLNGLRALYLLIAIGFGIFLLPGILFPSRPSTPTESVIDFMLLAFWLLTLLGVRYPLQMLPVLLWEVIWKTIWVAVILVPQWSSGNMDKFTEANISWIPLLILCYCAIPWRYVVMQYAIKTSEPWRKALKNQE